MYTMRLTVRKRNWVIYITSVRLDKSGVTPLRGVAPKWGYLRPLLAQPSLVLSLARVLGLVLVGLRRIAATQLLPVASFLAGALALLNHDDNIS